MHRREALMSFCEPERSVCVARAPPGPAKPKLILSRAAQARVRRLIPSNVLVSDRCPCCLFVICLEFKREECENFNAVNLSSDRYIKAGDRYFIPTIRSFQTGIDNYITTLDSLPKLRTLMQSPPLGLKWKETSEKPSVGTEIENAVLVAALRKKSLLGTVFPWQAAMRLLRNPSNSRMKNGKQCE